MLQKIVAHTFLTAFLALAAPSISVGQPGNDFRFKVGDRVEIDTLMSSDPRNATYKNGTIVALDDANPADKAYIVTLDSSPNKRFRYIIRNYTHHWVRAQQGGEGIQGIRPGGNVNGGNQPINQMPGADRLRIDNKNTVLADRDVLDCKHLKAGPARNGQSPPTELIKKLIRCTFERPSDTGQDGARTMDIVGFTPTGSRRWQVNEDRGMHATGSTIVYLYHVKYNKKTFYRTSTVSETGGERNFACYVDGNEWYCGTAAGGVKDGEKKSIPAKKN